MKFNFKEWNFIKHCIEVANRDFEKQMELSKQSESESSCYQIFKRQTEQAKALIARIGSSEI